jgi:N-methylhydantoinase A/acetophenone carboxylase
VGLLLSKGRADLAPTISSERKSPLVSPEMVRDLDGQVGPDGQIITPADPDQVLDAAQQLIDAGARCLVLALENSDKNPANERAARQSIKDLYPRDYLGSVPVFLAWDISRRAGENQRINGAVLNAYIRAKLMQLLYRPARNSGNANEARTCSSCITTAAWPGWPRPGP